MPGVYRVACEIGAFVVIHHEITEKMHQMVPFSQSRFSEHNLMNDSQMVVERKRMHVDDFFQLQKEKRRKIGTKKSQIDGLNHLLLYTVF